MYHFSGCNAPFFSAKFTEWMAFQKRGPSFPPVLSISFICLRISLIFIVYLVLESLVLLTITSVGKIGTPWIGTRLLGFVWHSLPPNTTRARNNPSSLYNFLQYQYTPLPSDIQVTFDCHLLTSDCQRLPTTANDCHRLPSTAKFIIDD